MTSMKDNQVLAAAMIPAVLRAGRAEMEIYQSDFTVATKEDNSPVTKADKVAEQIILDALAEIAPNIPVVSEEAASEGRTPAIGERFFLVDPLDGTKEFIKKSNEFTVNIALVENGRPVMGIVYAPALGELYLAFGENRAFMTHIESDAKSATLDEPGLIRLKTRRPDENGLVIVASKSHMTAETEQYIRRFNVRDLRSAGSSLKFCLLAKAEADLYPRFGPTMEWDTAAGHAILEAAGGRVTRTDGAPLLYGKVDENFLNPYFIAHARTETALEK